MKWLVGLLVCVHGLAVGFQFPHTSLYKLDETQDAVPHHCVETLFLGFSPEAKGELKRWYDTFRQERRLMPFTVMPVFPALMSTAVIRKPLLLLLDSYVPPHVRDHIGVIFNGADTVAASLHIPETELHALHVFVIDQKGDVLWHGCGGPTQQTISSMKQAVQAAQLSG